MAANEEDYLDGLLKSLSDKENAESELKDEEEEEIQVIKEDEYIVDGSIKITDVNELIGVRLESEEFDSIGGYIIGHLRRLPEENEVIEVDNIKFCIESLDKKVDEWNFVKNIMDKFLDGRDGNGSNK